MEIAAFVLFSSVALWFAEELHTRTKWAVPAAPAAGRGWTRCC